MTFRDAFAIIIGGGLGSFLRYWVSLMIPFQVSEFAWATFVVNMAGCFAIGTCYPFISDSFTRLFLVAGILGGFTTFSGFGLEMLRYAEAQQWKILGIYGLVSVILGTVLVYIGYKTGNLVK